MNKPSAFDIIRQWGESLINIIFPNVCAVCGRTLVIGEKYVCLDCMLNLPRTNFHKSSSNSLTERLFSLQIPITKATSMFYYRRGTPYVSIIHDTKYRNRPKVGKYFATIHAEELMTEKFFDDIDLLVPVPLHILKRLRRGYNQAEEIANAVSSVCALPVATPLKAKYHRTQTRKDSHARLQNSIGKFLVCDSGILENKHILLIDDVITTGSTILACAQAIKNASPSTTISVYSLAATQLE